MASTSAPAAAAAAAAAATPSVGAVRQQGDGWSPASRFQISCQRCEDWSLEARPSEIGSECEALRAQETRLRELAFFEARRAEDATKVTSGRVTLSNGLEARLGELDVEHASTIAVAMDVNEIASVELIVGAIENGAPADAAVPAAIGILMRERARARKSLLHAFAVRGRDGSLG